MLRVTLVSMLASAVIAPALIVGGAHAQLQRRPLTRPTGPAPTRAPLVRSSAPTAKIVSIQSGAKVKRVCAASVVRVSVCNGDACEHLLNAPCAPYGCDAKAEWCAASCVTDKDCAEGSVCATTTGKCAWMPTRCTDAFTIRSANGQTQSCAPYKCLANACQQQCVTSGDCASGYVCQDGVACVKQ
jgi:hypothetical protein